MSRSVEITGMDTLLITECKACARLDKNFTLRSEKISDGIGILFLAGRNI